MHKEGKWAKQMLALQDEEGKWGWFHSLSQSGNSPLTTEQALRRLERLGFTIEDECIKKAVSYMSDCLCGRKRIPDRREKVHNWDIFTALILSTQIRRFTYDNPNANETARKWAAVITAGFADGSFCQEAYNAAYYEVLGMKPGGGRLIDFTNFYPISLVRGCLDETTECLMLDYVLSKEGGIYYIYDRRLSVVPDCFASREASHYLDAMELLSGYGCAKEKLGFVVEWLMQNQKANGKWDMGKSVNNKVQFPLSDDWRKVETREADCTERIEKLLKALQ